MEGPERVRPRLRREALARERRREGADVIARDLTDGSRAEEVDDVDPQPVGVRLDRRRLAASPLLRRPLRLRLALLGTLARDLFTESAERRLGFGAGQAVSVLLGVDEAESALDLSAAVAPFCDPRVAVGSGTLDQRSAAVPGTPLRPRDRCSLFV
jgi:hypothetical protein